MYERELEAALEASRLAGEALREAYARFQKIADALEKKDSDQAKKLAEEVAKNHDLEDVMHLFKPRKDKGLGIGAKAGAVKPDGIELKVIALAMNEPPKKELEESSADLARAAYVAAAIAEVALVQTEEKAKGKSPKDWKNWAEGMRQGAIELADAAKAKKPADVKKAAEKKDREMKPMIEKEAAGSAKK